MGKHKERQSVEVTFQLPKALRAAIHDPDNGERLYERNVLFIWMLIREDKGADYQPHGEAKIHNVFPTDSSHIKKDLVSEKGKTDKIVQCDFEFWHEDAPQGAWMPVDDFIPRIRKAYCYKITDPNLLKGRKVRVSCESLGVVNGYTRLKEKWPTDCTDFD